MPMLPGIDPNNRVSPVVKRAAVGAVDAVNRANVRAGNIVPGMRYNVQGNGAGAFPMPNQNNPLQGSDGSLPPRAIGLGDTPLVYKDQQLYRNDGPYVGVNAQSGTAIYDENGLIGYVDMWWPDLNVIGEADGLVKYTSRDDVVREKRREDRLRALGPAVVRWTFEDIESRPQSVVAAIRRVGRRAA